MARAPASPLARKRVAVLPDFFLDAILRLRRWSDERPKLERILRHGGGNLPVGPVEFKAGGNAANVAVALARLGARVDLITATDPLGRHMLEAATRGATVNLRHVAVGETSSATIALEFGAANLMLSHAGPLRDFGPRRIAAAAWKAIESADAVVLNNWAQNRAGTDLFVAVSGRLERRKAFLYVDTSDPRHRGRDAQTLLRARRAWARVDAWGLNENEARAFAGDEDEDVRRLAQGLAERVGCPLDLHTREWAVSIADGNSTEVPAYRSRPRRLTGAGDAWNAGNLAGYLLDLSPPQRLRLAHRAATEYVTSRDGRPPTYQDLGLA